MRQFYNEDGTIAYKEYIDDKESVLYLTMHSSIVKQNLLHIS